MNSGQSKRSSILLFNLMFKRHPWRAIAVLLISTAVIFSSVGLLSTSSWLIAFCALSPIVADILVPVVFVRLFGLLRGILRYVERLISHETTFRLLGDLRALLFRTFSRRPMADVLRFNYTDAFNRLVDDIERLQDFYLRTFNPYLTAMLSGLFGWALLARTGLPESLVFLLVYGLAILFLPVVLYLMTRGLSRLQAEQSSQARGFLLELLGGLAELRATGSINRWTGNLKHQLDQLEQTEKRLGLSKSLATAWVSQLSLLAAVLVAWLGALRVINGELNPLLLPVEIYTVLALFEATQPIPALLQKMESSRLAAHRVLDMIRPDELVALATPVKDLPGHRQKSRTTLELGQVSKPNQHGSTPEHLTEPAKTISPLVKIELNHVSIRYPGQLVDQITDLSLVLEAGKRVAVVGPSGSGKTTLTYLLLGWLSPSFGTLEITPSGSPGSLPCGRTSGELDVPAGDRTALFSVVNQDVYFFNTTIRNNLKMGNLQADEPMFWAALDRVGLTETIANLPKGLDTELGEGETRLSGGQRQRLAIARALLRPAPFLVLDEATAGIDLLAEQHLLRNLLANQILDFAAEVTSPASRLPQHPCTLTISHRLVQMDAYDEILVLDQGRIAERGSHQELLALGGLYNRMWRLQKAILDDN
ncbi:MAG: putative transporter ATP-binding protein [Firmicutes bacterium]|nr:putative transporter ATP-binding protein [Bacillota bacterium]